MTQAYPAYRASGVEWLGDVPEGWDVGKFRHQFKESPEKIEAAVVGPMLSVSGYRGIEIKEYDDENRRRLEEDLIGYRIVRPGQLVVNTMWLNYAGLGVSDHEGHVSPAYRSYDFRKTVERRYFHHLLRSSTYVQGYTRLLTGIRPNSLQMSRDDLMDFPIVIPPLPEQTAIAAFLDRETAKIDGLVEQQQRLIGLLREKRQAVISHAVTRGLNPHAPLKPSGIDWLGDVPEGWEVGPLKRFWSVTDCKHLTADFVDEGFPLASIREVQSRFIELSEAKCTTEEYYTQLIEGGRKPLPGDLIFSRNATVGEVSQVSAAHPPFAMGQDVCLLRRMDERYAPDYMQAFFDSSFADKQLDVLMIGATFKRVNVEAIRNLIVVCPPASEQVQIGRHIQAKSCEFDTLTATAESAIALLQERRAALISAAVTGKIDVRQLTPQPVKVS
jgi:type I restriction enzyme S subunit